MLQSEILKERLRNEFMPIKCLKVYSKEVAVNAKLEFLKGLDKGIRGISSMVLDFFEARVNTDESKDNYMVVYASQKQIADELGFSREHICSCINVMAKAPNCIFEKVRQGLNKANYYIMTNKKKLIDLLKEIYKAQEEERKSKNEEKQSANKKQWNKKSANTHDFNDYDQRPFDPTLEAKLLGWS